MRLLLLRGPIQGLSVRGQIRIRSRLKLRFRGSTLSVGRWTLSVEDFGQSVKVVPGGLSRRLLFASELLTQSATALTIAALC